MSGVWRAHDVCYHLVVRQCTEMVQGAQVCYSDPDYSILSIDKFRVNIQHRMLGDPAAALDGIDQDIERSSTGSSGKDDKALDDGSQGQFKTA